MEQLLQLTLLLACATTSLAYYQQACAGKTLLRSGGLTCQDRQAIIDAHNQARQSVAQGKVSGQPGASKMLEMAWDEQLAQVAQRWADKCILAHDKSRHVARFPVGQNIAATWTTRKKVSPEPDFATQVTGWFNEVRSFAFYSTGFTKGTGHYSQLVWGDTYLVGCGYTHYYDPSRGNTKLYVCNYGPAGNVLGARPYQVGSPSCASQGFAASTRYPGLCEVTGVPRLGTSCSYSTPFGNYGTSSISSSYSSSYTNQPYPTQYPHTSTQYIQQYYG
ncbi:hypothetical protein L9F63_000697, partial [Diploptera punctata]